MDLDEVLVRSYEIGLELHKEWKLSFESQELSEIFSFHYGSPIPFRKHGFDSLDALLEKSDLFERCPLTGDFRCVKNENYEYQYEFPPRKGFYAIDSDSEDKELCEVIEKAYAIALRLQEIEKKPSFLPKEISLIYRSIYGEPIPHRRLGFLTLDEIFEESEHRFVFCEETNDFICRPRENNRLIFEEKKVEEMEVKPEEKQPEPELNQPKLEELEKKSPPKEKESSYDSDEEIRALQIAVKERQKKARVSDLGPPRFAVDTRWKMSLSPEPRRKRSVSRSPMKRSKTVRCRRINTNNSSQSTTPERWRSWRSRRSRSRENSSRSSSSVSRRRGRSRSRSSRRNRRRRSRSRGRITDSSRSSSRESRRRTRSPSSSPKMWKNKTPGRSEKKIANSNGSLSPASIARQKLLTSSPKTSRILESRSYEYIQPAHASSALETVTAAAMALRESRIALLVDKIVACLEKTVAPIHLGEMIFIFERTFYPMDFHKTCKEMFGHHNIFSCLLEASKGKFSLTKDECEQWFFAKFNGDQPILTEDCSEKQPAETPVSHIVRPEKPPHPLGRAHVLLSRAQSRKAVRAKSVKPVLEPQISNPVSSSSCQFSSISPPIPRKQNSGPPLPFLPHPSMTVGRNETSTIASSTSPETCLSQNTVLPPLPIIRGRTESTSLGVQLVPQEPLPEKKTDPLPVPPIPTVAESATPKEPCFAEKMDLQMPFLMEIPPLMEESKTSPETCLAEFPEKPSVPHGVRDAKTSPFNAKARKTLLATPEKPPSENLISKPVYSSSCHEFSSISPRTTPNKQNSGPFLPAPSMTFGRNEASTIASSTSLETYFNQNGEYGKSWRHSNKPGCVFSPFPVVCARDESSTIGGMPKKPLVKMDTDPLIPSVPTVTEPKTPEKPYLDEKMVIPLPGPTESHETRLAEKTSPLPPLPSQPNGTSSTPQKPRVDQKPHPPLLPAPSPKIGTSTPRKTCFEQKADPPLPPPKGGTSESQMSSLEHIPQPVPPPEVGHSTPKKPLLQHIPCPPPVSSTNAVPSTSQKTSPTFAMCPPPPPPKASAPPPHSSLKKNESQTPGPSKLYQKLSAPYSITPPCYPSQSSQHPSSSAGPGPSAVFFPSAAPVRSTPHRPANFLNNPHLWDLTLRIRHVLGNMGGQGYLRQVEDAYLRTFGKLLQAEFYYMVPYNTSPHILAQVSRGEIIVTQTREGFTHFRLKHFS